MMFKIGDKVKYKGRYAYAWGVYGTVVDRCSLMDACRIVRFPDGYERHLFTSDLVMNNKNQQLLFNFMEQ